MHPEIFKGGGGLNFSKSNQYSVVVNLVKVKQGFAILIAFCYNICLFKNPVIMILKVVGCEDCA